VLERESERAGGGWDFEISLPAAPIPPPFHAKVLKPSPSPSPVVALPTRAAVKPPPVQSSTRGPAPAVKPTPLAPPPLRLAPALGQGRPEGTQARPAPQSLEDSEERPAGRARPNLRDARKPR
jgi:hypothetical protein